MAADHRDEDGPAKVPELAWLRRLVTALAVTMIGGMVLIVALLAMRLTTPVLPELPAAIALPDGARPKAVTFAQDAWVVLTEGGEVLVYDGAGKLRGRVPLN